MGRLQLFDDDGGDSSNNFSKIKINHEYAKRLEHNKEREDLQRYEELKKQGRVDGSGFKDESSDEEDVKVFKSIKKTETKFYDALIKVKNKDPILKNKDAKLFDSESESASDSESERKSKRKSKKNKPMYLKDVNSKHLLEEGSDFEDEEDENEGNGEMDKNFKSYSEEQEEIRRNFLKAVEEENDDEGDFLRVKDNGVIDKKEDEDEIVEKLDVIFGEDDKLDDDTKFLKDYFRHKMWIDDGKNKNMANEEIELSEDEEEIEKQDDYEREFNFRYEENAGDRVVGHSREVEGSVRKIEKARTSQRKRKKERMLQAEFERKKELKHLNNLKKKETNEKLQKIREVAGMRDDENLLEEDDLEDEFDPGEHDRKMKKAFGDNYYKAEDVDPEFGSDEDIEKPDFDKEDDLLGLPKGWDEVKDFSEDGDDESKEGKRKRKRKVEKAVGEEYYKLDYEDIGESRTRFRYKPVAAKRFGLSPAEILIMDEKDLNQYVPLKKLAPYEEKEWKVNRLKTLQVKEKIKEICTGETSDSVNKREKKAQDDGKAVGETSNSVENEESRRTEVNGDTSDLSRKAKRRRRQNELKLNHSRLLAYGKVPSKSKSENK